MIKSSILCAEISEVGAELKFLRYGDASYIWEADPMFWGKSSPVLFPIVGALQNNEYLYGGQTFPLPRHGFAREQIFEVVSEEEDSVTYRLQESANSLLIYPFAFELKICYKLIGNILRCTYEVFNPVEDDLWFSLGAHPALKIAKGDILYFPMDEELRRYKLINGLLSEEVDVLILNKRHLLLESRLFQDDALVLKDLRSKSLVLKDAELREKLRFTFDNFPYFGIWSVKDAPFVCLEPWSGVADTIGRTQRLEEKEGILRLSSGQKWTAFWELEIII